MDHIIESESEEESRSKNDSNLGLIAADDASLTLEDQQDIQQLQEDRMSNLDNMGLRTRSNQIDLNPGLGEIQMIESEGGEDDLLDDISDDDSFAFQDLGNSGINSMLSDESMEDEMDESMEMDMSSDGSDGGIDGQSDIIINNLQQANEQSQDSENEDEMEDNDMDDQSDDSEDSADDGFDDDMDDNGSFGSYGEYGDEDENSNEMDQADRDRSEIMSFSQDPYYEEEDDEERSGEYSERGYRRVRNDINLPLPTDEQANSLRPDINVQLNSREQNTQEQ